ncbi:MAG: CAP domain-containing protein [Pirellulales bacterium]|nr:CAP domain-containing protein [Pirellulales bacterium]
MRTLALIVASVVTAFSSSFAVAQTTVHTSYKKETYLCPKCNKLHVRRVPITRAAEAATSKPSEASAEVSKASYQQSEVKKDSIPVAKTTSLRASKGVINVLGALNAQRARRGIGRLRYDPQLQLVAERRARKMAASGYKNHPPGSFAPGRYEGVGWSSSFSPSRVRACFTNDSRMRYAGAAMATGRDGVYFAVVYR